MFPQPRKSPRQTQFQRRRTLLSQVGHNSTAAELVLPASDAIPSAPVAVFERKDEIGAVRMPSDRKKSSALDVDQTLDQKKNVAPDVQQALDPRKSATLSARQTPDGGAPEAT